MANNGLDNPTTSSVITSYKLEFLCSLIPDRFDGNRYELGQFLANCNNANELATNEQKTPLFYFILSKISGKAKDQLAQQTFKNWSELKEKLKILYQDKKHYVQIMEELNNCKQHSNESVSDFFQRLEILNSRALSAAQQHTKNVIDLPGKIQTINELTLNRFIHHSSPNISQMLRWKDLENLNSAYTAALTEERALNINRKFCKICRKNNHDTSQCTLKNKIPQKPINTIQNSQSYSVNKSSQFQNKFCNYCKKPGHLINECRKREYNNSRKIKSQNPNFQELKPINLNLQQSGVENTSLTDQIASLTVFEN